MVVVAVDPSNEGDVVQFSRAQWAVVVAAAVFIALVLIFAIQGRPRMLWALPGPMGVLGLAWL